MQHVEHNDRNMTIKIWQYEYDDKKHGDRNTVMEIQR